MSYSSLAEQLAELASASSQGLLSDDEYRLLRQNAFNQHSSNALIPIEIPIVPTIHSDNQLPPPSLTVQPSPPRTRSSQVLPIRLKNSILASVATLLGRTATRDTPNKTTYTSPTSPKLGVIPRRRRASNLLLRHTASKRDHSPGSKSESPLSRLSFLHIIPNSPSTKTLPTFPPPKGDLPSSDLLDDANLHTSKDIRAAISTTEIKAQYLFDAFNSLESSTSSRVHQQISRHLLPTTPAHFCFLMADTEGRDHKPQLPPSPHSSKGKSKRYARIPPPINIISDRASVGSSLSQPNSVSLQSWQPSSPMSPRFLPSSPSGISARKNSVSSASSRPTPARPSMGSLSRTTQSLAIVLESERMMAIDHPEVSEIQQRKDEVMARYNARLEYLRAKLKSAELHEKLLR